MNIKEMRDRKDRIDCSFVVNEGTVFVKRAGESARHREKNMK